MSGSFLTFTGPARCEVDYQRACVRSVRVVRCHAPAGAPSLGSPQLEYLREEPCRVHASAPMPGMRASGPALPAATNPYCDVAATRPANPAGNRAEQGTRA